MNSTRVSVLVCAMAAAALLVGCSAPKPATKLTFMNTFTSSDYEKTYSDLIEKFTSERKDVVIDNEPYDATTLATKIKTLAAGNQLPEMLVVSGADLEAFYKAGLVMPVNDIINADTAWSGGFYQGAFNDFTIGDKILGFPFQLTATHLVFYNTKVFADAGISEFPKTWSDFTTAIIALKQKGYTPIALGNKDKWVAESCIVSTLGDRYTGSGWLDRVKNKQAKFTDPEFVSALRAFQQLAAMGAFNKDLNSLDNSGQEALYYKGKTGMFMEGGWAVGLMDANAPADIKQATALAVLPAVEGGKGKPLSTSGGAGLAIALRSNLTADQKAAATSLLKYLFTPINAETVVEASGSTAYKPAKIDSSKLGIMNSKFYDFIGKISYSPVYDIHLNASVIGVLNTGLQNLTIGKGTPEGLARAIQGEMDRVE